MTNLVKIGGNNSVGLPVVLGDGSRFIVPAVTTVDTAGNPVGAGAGGAGPVPSATSTSFTPATDAYGLLPSVSTNVLLSAAATTNATVVKASAGAIKSIQGYNAKAAPVFLKFYNKASAPTVGTDTPVKTLYVPATSAFVFDFPAGYVFPAGIAYALTGAAPVADTTALVAGDILALNVDYI